MSLRAIALLIMLIGSIPLSFVRPFFGIIVWTIIAFVSPQWYTWGSAKMIPWAMLIAIPTLAGFFLLTKGWSRLWSRETMLLGALWFWFSFTTVATSRVPEFIHHATETQTKWVFVSKILLMTLVIIGVVDSFERLRTLILTIACCFGLFIAKGFTFVVLSGGSHRIYGPARSMIADNNDFGLALNMTAPIFFFLAISEKNVWWKRLFGTLFILSIPCIFFTYSRGALVGLIAVLGVMFLRLKQRIFLIPIFSVAALVAVLFTPESWKERMNPQGEGVFDRSVQGRFNAWQFSWNLANQYPLTGGGFDTFTYRLFATYAPDARDIHGPHSVYFGVLGEHGFPGLILYLILVGSCFVTASWIVKWAKFYGDEVAANYANMFRFALVGFLTSGLFLGRAYFDYYFLIVGCLVVLRKTCVEKWLAQEGTPAEEAEEDSVVPEDLPGVGLARS